MKKTTKILAIILFVCLICSCFIQINAAEVEPREDEIIDLPLENCYECGINFEISNTGLAEVTVDYSGNPNTFTYAHITAKIQKQVFLFIWTDVAVNANNQWVVDSYNLNDYITLDHQLDSTGTYRAIITVDIYGTGNSTDSFNDTIQDTY
ncbi:MAG: hypothetical protein IKP68_10230 [Clostridia bacterium]|nr:hypothetical protein [Clostridia bacterium]